MRAWVLYKPGDIRFETVDIPSPLDDEVLVRVDAVGICGSDIPRVYTTGAHRHPLIPGHEFSGTIEELGRGVTGHRSGDRVGVYPLIPCGVCAACRQRHPELCRDYGYLGSRSDGGFAEYVRVPAANIIALSDSIGAETAAMLEPMSVAAHALRRAGLAVSRIHGEGDVSDKIAAVVGLGTIGLLVTMLLRVEGYRVIAVGNKESQRKKAMLCGVEDGDIFIGANPDIPGAAEVVFECVGKTESLSLAVGLATASGIVVTVGNPYSDMTLPRDIYWRILREQLTITGTWNSTFVHDDDDDWHYIIKLLEERRFDPSQLISHRLPLESLEDGLLIMRNRSEDYTKIMIVREGADADIS